MLKNAICVFSWEYPDKTKHPHGEKLWKLPNGSFYREQWVEGRDAVFMPCSGEHVLELLVMLEKEG